MLSYIIKAEMSVNHELHLLMNDMQIADLQINLHNIVSGWFQDSLVKCQPTCDMLFMNVFH